eukprot:5874768-Prymnesium_polylepis.2
MSDDGEPSGIFVELVLVADKPFIRHACGMLSHNANSFGPPLCECCDEGDEEEDSDMYDYTMDKREHCGKTTYETLCHRAHTAPWEALNQPEPAWWHFACPCCGEVRCARRRAPRPIADLMPPSPPRSTSAQTTAGERSSRRLTRSSPRSPTRRR